MTARAACAGRRVALAAALAVALGPAAARAGEATALGDWLVDPVGLGAPSPRAAAVRAGAALATAIDSDGRIELAPALTLARPGGRLGLDVAGSVRGGGDGAGAAEQDGARLGDLEVGARWQVWADYPPLILLALAARTRLPTHVDEALPTAVWLEPAVVFSLAWGRLSLSGEKGALVILGERGDSRFASQDVLAVQLAPAVALAAEETSLLAGGGHHAVWLGVALVLGHRLQAELGLRAAVTDDARRFDDRTLDAGHVVATVRVRVPLR